MTTPPLRRSPPRLTSAVHPVVFDRIAFVAREPGAPGPRPLALEELVGGAIDAAIDIVAMGWRVAAAARWPARVVRRPALRGGTS